MKALAYIAVARAARAFGHRVDARFPFDAVGRVSLGLAALFMALAVWAGLALR